MTAEANYHQRSHAAAFAFSAMAAAKANAVYAFALAIFAVSRAVVFAGLEFGRLLKASPAELQVGTGPNWYHRLLQWDSGYYIEIARNGYSHPSDPTAYSPTAFYPLYPLLGRCVSSITGLQIEVALVVVANVASLIAALLMTKLIKEEAGEQIALWSVAFYFFFPFSFFLSAGYTESLCLVFVLLALMALKQERFVLASIFAGLALATRSAGIVLLPVILIEIYRHQSSTGPQKLAMAAVCTVLATSGLTAYMAYLWAKFGDPLTFVKSQAAWHQGTFLSRFASSLSLEPLRNGKWFGWFSVFVIFGVWSFWFLRLPIALYGLGVILLPYLTLGITDSMGRFMLMCFPAFVCLAILCKSRPMLSALILAVSGVHLFQQIALYSRIYWVG